MPRVDYHFFVCTNRRDSDSPLPSCGARGSEAVYQRFVREVARRGYPTGVKATATGCLTPCQWGPNVVVYPEQTWYANVTGDDVAEIVAAHLDNNGIVERLTLPEEVRVS